MPEVERSWARTPDAEPRRLDEAGVIAASVAGLAQHLVSGDLAAAAARAGVDPAGVGAFAKAAGRRYSVRMARDRLLIVSEEENLLESGWHGQDGGFAVTGVSAAFEIVDLSGPRLSELLKRATTIPLDTSSPSAATIFAGAAACIYRVEDRVRLHVDRGHGAYIWEWLERTLTLMRDDG